jgi:hypothetical protein
MQTLDTGIYEAKWGSYRMKAYILPSKKVHGYEQKRCGGELIVIHDDGAETSVLKCINTDGPGLIRQFVDYMEKHGLVAVVNGEKRDLADFLVFEPVARVLH